MIINIFPFFDELDALEIRLKELAGVVDRFVLVESTKTFTYRNKPLHYAENRRRFQRWWSQIDHYVLDSVSGGGDCWSRERHQRNHLMYGLIGHDNEALVVSCDADEVPRADAVKATTVEYGEIKQFSLYHCHYFLDVENRLDPACIAKVMTLKTLIDNGGPEVASRKTPIAHVERGGWHFAYLGGPAGVASKLRSFSHTEFASEHFTNEDKVRERIEKLLDPVDRKCDMRRLDDLPACVIAGEFPHLLKYEHAPISV